MFQFFKKTIKIVKNKFEKNFKRKIKIILTKKNITIIILISFLIFSL